MLRLPRVALIGAKSATLRKPTVLVQARFISAQDVFGKVDVSKIPDLPPLPLPPPPQVPIDQLIEAKVSVLQQLGLFSWYTPSSYFRYALEAIHMHLDIPWWATLACATLVLRLLLIKVVVISQKNVALQSQYRPELQDFQKRVNDAKAENNAMEIQQVLVEQRNFMLSKDIKLGRQMAILLANGVVFATQFFAVRRMANAPYPGLEAGGALWFPDLTATDPFYALPLISAATMALVLKLGVESGQTADQMSPLMRYGMQYGLPVIVFASSTQFPAALCVYWTTSNIISLFYAGLFKLKPVRNFFNIPDMVAAPKNKEQGIKSVWKDYKAQKAAPPTLESLRLKDAAQFKQAGRGKPVQRAENS